MVVPSPLALERATVFVAVRPGFPEWLLGRPCIYRITREGGDGDAVEGGTGLPLQEPIHGAPFSGWRDVDLLEIDISEFQKAEAGLTCLSLLIGAT